MGHWTSMNISIVTGAFGLPSVSSFCGTPLKRLFPSVAPCSAPAQFWLPVGGKPAISLGETTALPPPLPPPLRTTPRTIATTMARTTTPPIASARGEAWRARAPPTPFERTGGGAATAACCLCCLALLPLGMRGKGSRNIGLPGRCQDQESDEKQKGGQGELRDREIAEGVPDDPVRAAAAAGDEARARFLDHPALDQDVVDRGAGSDDRERDQVARRPVVAARGNQEREDRERVHHHALEPAELAGDEAGDLRVEEAAAGRDRRDHEGSPQLVAPEQVADPVKRPADAHQREHADDDPEGDQHLSDDAEDGEEDHDVRRHPAAGYPSLRWALR